MPLKWYFVYSKKRKTAISVPPTTVLLCNKKRAAVSIDRKILRNSTIDTRKSQFPSFFLRIFFCIFSFSPIPIWYDWFVCSNEIGNANEKFGEKKWQPPFSRGMPRCAYSNLKKNEIIQTAAKCHAMWLLSMEKKIFFSLDQIDLHANGRRKNIEFYLHRITSSSLSEPIFLPFLFFPLANCTFTMARDEQINELFSRSQK